MLNLRSILAISAVLCFSLSHVSLADRVRDIQGEIKDAAGSYHDHEEAKRERAHSERDIRDSAREQVGIPKEGQMGDTKAERAARRREARAARKARHQARGR